MRTVQKFLVILAIKLQEIAKNTLYSVEEKSMKHKNCPQIHKLSSSLDSASLSKAKERLGRLRQLTVDCAEIGEEISQVVAGLRQVAAPDGQPFLFTTVLKENKILLDVVFRDCADIKYRSFQAKDRQALLVYLHGMTDMTILEKDVLQTLMSTGQEQNTIDLNMLVNNLLTSAGLTVSCQANQIIEAVMTGNTLLLVDGIAQGLLIATTRHVKRPISEGTSEDVMRGPHDAFNETLNDNLVLIRRRTRDTNIKIRIMQIGERSKTAVAVLYAANLVKPGLVEEVERRLQLIKVDKILSAGMVEEWLVDRPWSPFPQMQGTERPDKMVAALYEGRVGIIIDNTPFTLMAPCTYNLIMQSADDYTMPPLVSSVLRATRHIAAFIAIYLPSLYVAIISYHPGMLPTTMAISVAEIRARTPFPSFLEALLMEALLEIFQEAVVRLPRKIAPAASMLGGFIIGNTVVQAGLINPLLVVIIATTAIASYVMPSYAFSMGLRTLRVPMLLLASIFGLYGVMLGILAVTIHVCSLKSFGESYLGGILNINLIADWKDSFVRLPQRLLTTRPQEFGSQDPIRSGGKNG
jgi:hypothetical protein